MSLHTAAHSLGAVASVGIMGIGTRFLVDPRGAQVGFGIAPGNVRGLTAIKGVRDITLGIVLLTVWTVAGPKTLGWAMVAASVTPVGDAFIVASNGGTLATALSIHGVTAALLAAAGAVLVLA